ncbi:hypothetical protein NQ315_014987 [Exocentrus adspersus]|uniref:Secreted protein n=1 Tax=Exocentrus adspersus TaxID=1586481 RepID=A0AAV8VWM4_9CUCU|nr:hypothetical protein NQ315_014987 [Exocentrus adspersus]
MNAFYVTVSIPILLVLAGFNHAHGLTTFGKSNGQGQGSSAHQTDGSAHVNDLTIIFIVQSRLYVTKRRKLGKESEKVNNFSIPTIESFQNVPRQVDFAF